MFMTSLISAGITPWISVSVRLRCDMFGQSIAKPS
jgi:hypothetical protein